MWCAGKLGNCPQGLTRFRFTCLHCRWRRKYYGKWTDPPFWITYTLPWSIKHYVALNPQKKVVAAKTVWKTLKIDPRGHFTMLRCSVIVMLDKIMRRFPKVRYPLLEFCEFFSNYPTF